ncbi:MAG: DNA-processing protein DprA [Acidobacteriota bacterium]
MDERDVLIALNQKRNLSRAAVCRLGLDVSTWRDAKRGDRGLAEHLGVPLAQLDKALAATARAPQVASAEERAAAEQGCRVLTRLDDEYPSALGDLSLPPPVLYCRGSLPDGPALGIVGSRRASSEGLRIADLFAAGLAARGVVVVSGFAVGVDQKAHRAAVEVGGKTVAVHGCGLDIDYPRGSKSLSRAIAASGASITEFPFGSEPRAWHFPVRNRVIAALSAGVLVAQAKQRSGSLITARLALELGRDVFAVPGSIFEPLSMGGNGLIADGAAAVMSPDDVLDHLSLGWQATLFPEPSAGAPQAPGASTSSPPRLPDGAGRKVYGAIPDRGAATAEDIAGALGLAVDQVLATLLELELQGYVLRQPGPVYVRALR